METSLLMLLASVPVLLLLGIGIGGFALLAAPVLPPRASRRSGGV